MNESGAHHRVVNLEGVRLKSVRIKPEEYQASTLIGELADAWVARSKMLAPTTTANYVASIRLLGKFLNDEKDRFLTMSGDGYAVAARLHHWEKSLIEKYQRSSTRPKKLGIQIRVLVQYWMQDNGMDATVLGDWSDSNVLDQRENTSAPLDEFSNSERISLRDKCRGIVRETERRLQLGESLLARGRDPRIHGWNVVENVLWALTNLPFSEEFRHEVIGPGCKDYARSVARLSGVEPPRGSYSTCVPAVARFLLSPTSEYLLAIRILLHLETGWSPEESRLLRREDVIHEGNVVRVRTTKLRARRIRWESLPTSGGPSPGWKSGDLIVRAANSMRFAHSNAEEGQPFWVAGFAAYRGQAPYDYPGFSIRDAFRTNSTTLKRLIDHHNLPISEPHDMRRIRKTVKSIRAVRLGTLHGSAGDDHSVEVFQGYYAPTTTVNTVAARTVIRAQGKALRRAIEGPTVHTESAADLVGNRNQDVAHIAGEVAGESDIEKELSIAGCSAPYNSPFEEDGKLCHASPSLCLECPNAVVFRDHLPRLAAYENILRGLKNSMNPVVFDATYGKQSRNLHNILNLFDPADVEMARDHPMPLHRELGERGGL
ncbi:hypothetical protein [Tomitella biformata]|uniref:hypothetical protein n=1 Tax=Tomitella biformata TaxID=630403 RepID=UPI0004AC824C|nr:hypothetical protein [Tomitella biformata]